MISEKKFTITNNEMNEMLHDMNNFVYNTAYVSL